MTSEHSSQQQLMLFAEDFHAKTFPMRENESESLGREADFGPKCSESFARFDLDSLSWKTCRHCATEDSTEFLGTWPAAGTMRSGVCFRRVKWVPHTHAKECSLWPTPTASHATGSNAAGSSGRKTAIRNGTYMSSGHATSHREWLMGFPIAWTRIDALETQSSQPSRSGSDDV